MNKTQPWLLSVPLLLGCSWSSFAEAKRQFPADVQRDLGLSYEVPCSVCHIKGNTGSSTAITPLALSLRARGLSGDTQSLQSALAKLETDGVDSDGDGRSDYSELQAGTDPNSSANASIINDQEPGYGCGGTAPRGGAGGPSAAAALLSWYWLRRRRGRA